MADDARRILGDDVISDPSLNGVFLRRGTSANPGVHHYTLPNSYVSSVNQRIVDAFSVGGRAGALDELAAIKPELMFLQGFTP